MANLPDGWFELTQSSSGDWLSIRKASRFLGIHIGTVRQWADAGTLPSYRTPGGHRRFLRSDLQKFLEAQHKPSTKPLSTTEQALSRVRAELQAHPHADWLQSQSQPNDPERAKQRAFGQHLLACVVAFVEDSNQHDQLLDQGRRIAREYGCALAASGISAGNAARATIYFRKLVLKTVLEVQLGSRTSDEEGAHLFQRVSTFLDEILFAILEAYP